MAPLIHFKHPNAGMWGGDGGGCLARSTVLAGDAWLVLSPREWRGREVRAGSGGKALGGSWRGEAGRLGGCRSFLLIPSCPRPTLLRFPAAVIRLVYPSQPRGRQKAASNLSPGGPSPGSAGLLHLFLFSSRLAPK